MLLQFLIDWTLEATEIVTVGFLTWNTILFITLLLQIIMFQIAVVSLYITILIVLTRNYNHALILFKHAYFTACVACKPCSLLTTWQHTCSLYEGKQFIFTPGIAWKVVTASQFSHHQLDGSKTFFKKVNIIYNMLNDWHRKTPTDMDMMIW